MISPYHGSKVDINKMCSSINVSSQTNSSPSLGKSDISSAKINDFFDFCRNKLEIEFLQDENPFIIFSPNHPSSEDELKWIEMGYNQGLAKENIMSQPLNRKYGS